MSTIDSRLADLEDSGWCAEFPQLASLGLSPTDMAELSRQGFVGRENRSGHMYWKLRFRRQGRQVARYLGCREERAATVRAEVLRLQEQTRVRRELKSLARQARELLIEAKIVLTPVAEAQGWHFHGLALRKPHQPKQH